MVDFELFGGSNRVPFNWAHTHVGGDGRRRCDQYCSAPIRNMQNHRKSVNRNHNRISFGMHAVCGRAYGSD